MRALPAEWVTLAPGVRLKLRRPDGLDQAVVEARTSQVMSRVILSDADLEEYGFEAADRGVMAQPHVLLGLSTFVSSCSFAELLIQEWEIGDTEGPQPDLTPENIRALLRHGATPEDGLPLLRPFQAWLNAPALRRAQEGKGSPPSQSGIGAGAASTARDAETKTPPARGAKGSTGRSAPMSSTSRRRPKAS